MRPLLERRAILVTGAARGIGCAVAAAALHAGARVLLADIDEGPCIAAAEALGGAESGAHAVALDVADPASAAAAAETAGGLFGGLDGLVNNAAICVEGHAAEVTPSRFAEVLSVNLISILTVTQAMLPLMRGRDASVVNTLSTQAMLGQPATAAYASSKGGSLALTRSMAVDLATQGLRVNAVAPGFIDTRMAVTATGEHEHNDPTFREHYLARRRIPLGRAGRPEDCAGAFVFLLSDLSAYMTGQVLVVDGGLTATY